MSDVVRLCDALVVALPLVWVLGYRKGRDEALMTAVNSLRYSALLHRASGFGGQREVADAAICDEWADRLERRRIRPTAQPATTTREHEPTERESEHG